MHPKSPPNHHHKQRQQLDHHCPWTGKCIGQKNLCFFYAFLVCLTIHILYVGVVTGMNAITTGFHVNNGGGRQ